MEIKHIKGATYYIETGTNIGVYMPGNDRCILIDAGYRETAEELLKYMKSEGLSVQAVINTHGHVDHAGGDMVMRQQAGAIICAPAGESDFIEKPELELLGLTCVPSFGTLNNLFLDGRHCRPDIMMKPGYIAIGETDFDIISLAGHSADQMGVVTPDGVLFCGDALFTHAFIKKYKLPYICDVGMALATLERMRNMRYQCYVPSHGEILYKIEPAVEENVALIKDVIAYISGALNTPLTREELCSVIMEHYNVWMSVPQHFLMMSYTSAFLRYLYENGIVEPTICDYSLKWQSRKV